MSRRVYLYALAFAGFAPVLVSAQGLLRDDAAYEQIPRQSQYGDGSKTETEALRDLPKVDWRPYCPVPQVQGAIASCTGWAAGYGAMTIQKAIANNWKGMSDSITRQAFSAMFIYNQIKIGTCNGGSSFVDAGRLIKEKGNILSASFDKNPLDCNKKPTETDLVNALSGRIQDCIALFAPKDPDYIKIQKTKLSLAQKMPVLVGMDLLQNFTALRAGDQYWFPAVGRQTPFGAHAMTVVGYDDGREAFEVMNSWGKDWGNGGFIWIKYADFARYTFYGFQFVWRNPTLATLEAACLLRIPAPGADGQIAFDNMRLTLKGKVYEPTSGALPRSSLMQPLVQQVTGGTYLYAFSYDPKGSIKVHWPRDQRFDEQYEGLPESAVISHEQVQVTIPGPYSALQCREPGSEHLCLLFSAKPLEDLNEALARLRQMPVSGDFLAKLYKSFGSVLLPLKDVQYRNSEVAGFDYTATSGKAIPVVIRLNIN
jgi:Papain family cysteine protease